MLVKLLAIAANTLLEAVRQPICGVILMVTAGLLMLNVALAGFTLEDDNKLLQDLGLSTLLLSGLFLAAFSATGGLSREIENKTVLTVISKPVSRPVFIAGKFVGLSAALAVAFYLSAIVFLFTIRHRVMETARDEFDMPVWLFGFGALALVFLIGGAANFLYRMTFSSTAVALAVPLFTVALLLVCLINPQWEIQSFGQDFVDGQILAATSLIFLAVLVLTAFAVAVSTRFGEVVTLVVCAGVLELGLMSDYLFGRYADQHWIADLAYRIVPNLSFFWVTDALTQERTISAGYVLQTAGYAGCHILAALLMAIALFQRREVG